MISNDDIDTLSRATAYGPDGDKLGRVGEVYLDNDTGRPAWITVVTGLFGTRRHFAPIDEAELDSSGVRLPYDKDTITGAPNIDENGELTPLEEDELYRYYRRAGDTGGAAGRSGPAGGDTGRDTGAPHTGETYGTPTPPAAGQSHAPTAGQPHTPPTPPAAGQSHAPTADFAREEIAGDYRPSEGQRDAPLGHSVPGGTGSISPGTGDPAGGTPRHSAADTGSDQEIVGPGPTGPAHSPSPAGGTPTAGDDTTGSGGADAQRPRKPRLVRRVVTTEYYEEATEDDGGDTPRS